MASSLPPPALGCRVLAAPTSHLPFHVVFALCNEAAMKQLRLMEQGFCKVCIRFVQCQDGARTCGLSVSFEIIIWRGLAIDLDSAPVQDSLVTSICL